MEKMLEAVMSILIAALTLALGSVVAIIMAKTILHFMALSK